MTLFDDNDLMLTVAKEIEAEGGDPLIVLPLLHIVTEAGIQAARAKGNADHLAAAMFYGKVSGIMEAFAVLGQPLPADDPASLCAAAEAALSNPEMLESKVAEAVEKIKARGEGDERVTVDLDYTEGEGHPQMDAGEIVNEGWPPLPLMDSPWDYEERDDTPYMTEDYDFHNEQAAGEDE